MQTSDLTLEDSFKQHGKNNDMKKPSASGKNSPNHFFLNQNKINVTSWLTSNIQPTIHGFYRYNPYRPFKKIYRLFNILIVLFIFPFMANALPSGESGDEISTVPVRHTFKELRDQNVVKQQLDYSCGAAALATLISGYYGENTSEKELLELLNARLSNMSDKEKSRKKLNGFSLLDLKLVAQQKGYKAAGFKLTIDQLKQLSAPVIVFVLPMGYHHFAVLRSIVGDRVYLADPGRGNLRMSVARFADEYGGIIFVLGKAGEEDITLHKLLVGRPDDFTKPDVRNFIYRTNFFTKMAVDFALRVRSP
ncbi:MAG: C39 family peptidase [Methyloglobulus sp.]|nr:C39 family peptidase [Methyloglobulus sp.]